jgi:hypothetical protein
MPVETSRSELEATWWAIRTKRKIKNIAFAKDGLCDGVNDINWCWQHPPEAPVIEFFVDYIAKGRIATRDTDIGKRAANFENQVGALTKGVPY